MTNKIDTTKNYYDIEIINKQPVNEIIKDSEEGYTEQVKEIVNITLNLKSSTKFILVAGPSSSGKTTSSFIIKNSLKKQNIVAKVISLDDFFLERDETPLLPNGEKDYDSLKSIDWPLFKKCMKKLIEEKEAVLPTFDFVEGKKRYDNEPTTLNDNEIIILEGLHALNPIINNYIPTKFSVKIYICPQTAFEINEEEKLDIYTLRLMRRLIRDVRTRGISPETTLRLWKNVRAAEELYIEPYKKDADFVVDTTHPYEPLVYKTILKSLLVNYEKDLTKLLEKLETFEEIKPINVPESSLLKEFVG